MCGMWVCAWAPHGSRGTVAVRGDDGGELEFPVENLKAGFRERINTREVNWPRRKLQRPLLRYTDSTPAKLPDLSSI